MDIHMVTLYTEAKLSERTKLVVSLLWGQTCQAAANYTCPFKMYLHMAGVFQ